QPAHVRDGRRHLDLRVPPRDPAGRLLVQCRGGPLQLAHQLRPAPRREPDQQAAHGDEPVVGTRRIRFKESTGERLFGIGNVALMLALVVVTLYPLLYVLFASLSSPTLLAGHRGLLFGPLSVTLEAYRRVFENPMILTGYRNTLFYVIAGTTLNVFMTALGAYALSRRDLLFKNPIMFFIVFTMFFGGGLIPTYLLVGQTLHMQDTPWALIVPGAITTINRTIMRTAFNAVPASLEEAARIDGANDWTILFKIYLPLSWPVVAVMILFYGVAHWNSFFPAMVYLRTRELYPLQLVLREILISSNVQNMTTDVSSGDVFAIGETIKYATIIVATLPILFVYPYLQRYFVKGVMIEARWEGRHQLTHAPLIGGRGLRNVAITGRGTIDGRGAPWWARHRAGTLEHPRPRLISFAESTNVLVDGITATNSPAWTINPV